MTSRTLLQRLPLHAVLVALILLWSVPTIALLVSSFREPTAISSSGWWHAAGEDLTLRNYRTVLAQQGLARSLVNSVLISVPATLLLVFVSALAAYAFAWMRFPGRTPLFFLVVALLVVPLQVTLIPVLRLLGALTVPGPVPVLGGNWFGVSSYAGIWLAHVAYGLPFGIFLLRNFFASLPRDLIEAAQLDGASEWLIFTRVVLPLSGSALAALGIFQFLWVWNDLLIALVFLGDPDLAPLPLRITNLVSSYGSSYQVLTAAAFISMAIPLVVFFAFQRYFVRGILAGATKG